MLLRSNKFPNSFLNYPTISLKQYNLHHFPNNIWMYTDADGQTNNCSKIYLSILYECMENPNHNVNVNQQKAGHITQLAGKCQKCDLFTSGHLCRPVSVQLLITIRDHQLWTDLLIHQKYYFSSFYIVNTWILRLVPQLNRDIIPIFCPLPSSLAKFPPTSI